MGIFTVFALLSRGTTKEYEDLALEIATISCAQAYGAKMLQLPTALR
jgi:hypothetical protein